MADDQPTFVRIARDDDDLLVRSAALEKLSSVDDLASFLDVDDLHDLALKLVCAKIDTKHSLLQRTDVRQAMLAQVASGSELVQIAQLQAAPKDVAETIFLSAVPRVRHEAIELVANIDVLTHCERISRNKDKSVHRFIRDRLAEVKRLANSRDDTLARAEQLIESASRTNVGDSHYASLREAQESSWNQILEELANLNEYLAKFGVEKLDLDMLKTRFPRRSKSLEGESSDPSRFLAIIRELEEAADQLVALEVAEQTWLETLRVQKPPTEISNQFFELTARIRSERKHDETREQLSTRLNNLKEIDLELPDLENRDNWPKLWSLGKTAKKHRQVVDRFLQHRDFTTLRAETQKEWQEQLQSVIARCEAIVQRTDELFESTIKNIAESIESIQAKIQEGSLKPALAAERHTRNLILRLPEGARKQQFDALAPHSAELKQLLNWKSFAIRPKREELCQQIEKLQASPLPPQEQFDQMRELRAAWNALGPPSSRDEVELQERYDLAAEAAWLVCEAWFEEQKKERAANSARKEALARELENFMEDTNWEAPNWREVQHTLTQHLNQFKEIGQVERNRSRSVNRRFFNAYGAIRDRLIEHREGTAKAKEQLVERAKELCADESLEQFDRVNKIKDLQDEWKAVGPTFHKVEEKLWAEFRDLCNSVFDDLRTQREERKETITQNIEHAKSMVDKLLRKAKRAKDTFDGNALREVETQLVDMFLPARVKKDLDRKLAQIDDIMEDRKIAVSRLQVSDRLRLLLAKDSELAKYEAEDAPIPLEWYDDIQNEMIWFESRASEAEESALRDIVLRAEIAADIEPTSEDDTERRLALRVGDLNTTMGRRGSSKSVIAEGFVRDWVGVAHGEQPLRERFNRALEELLKQLNE